MGRYSVGIETKNKILAEAKTLFYEQGFNNTSFLDIGKAAEVNKALITYHFKNKNNLAKEIFFEFSRNQQKACGSVLACEHGAVAAITSLMLFYKLIMEDENLKRFWYDIAVADVISDMLFWEEEVFLKKIASSLNISVPEDELFTIYCIENGMEIELIKNIFLGNIKEPIDSVFEKQYKVTLSLLGVYGKEAQEIIQKSFDTAKEIKAERKGYFEVEYTRAFLIK